jgi:carbon storage regulator
MLVLSRGIEDAIVIGDDVEITVLEIKGNTVKLGITAPADVSVSHLPPMPL